MQRRPYLLLALASIFVLIPHAIEAYRLNVPRVLLPYHPTTQVQFLLEVSHTGHGCFNWRSSRPNVVSIEAVNPQSSGCSDKAIITAKSKQANEENAVIFVENQGEGVSFSCDVTVDKIHSIDITTTTKVLFMDAAPARMIVEAMNHEGDRFSTLGNIPFDWQFSFKDGGESLKIIPFSESNYDAPPEIEELERQGKKGYVVLVEGLLTGSGQLTAKFSEDHFSSIEPSAMELFAVANVMLVPSNDLYLPVNSIVKYGATVMRKDHDEEIALPSPHYSIEVSDQSVCDFDPSDSLVVAKALGTTDVTLIDSTGVEKLKGIVKPRSAHLYVVEPTGIRFTIEPGNVWFLQKDEEYRITMSLVDAAGNVIFIPENAIFTTKMPEEYLKVVEKSTNNTYFKVRAIKTGKSSIKSAFESMIGKDGKVFKAQPVVQGEQEVVVSDQVVVDPKLLYFPYHAKRPYEYQLKASGGTGRYEWTSSERSVAEVHKSSGLMKTDGLGQSVIYARDSANQNHYDTAKVVVAEPYELHFGPSAEAAVGSRLTLNLKLTVRNNAGIFASTDCRNAPFKFSMSNHNVFIVDDTGPSSIPSQGAGCATVSLIALAPGETRLTASFEGHTAHVDISAYVSLTGIRIVASSLNVENGNVINAHVRGITEDGEDFHFDDAIYPFAVNWRTSSADVAQIQSPIADFIDEPPMSRFSVNLHTQKSGKTILHATVRLDSKTRKHFKGDRQEYSDKVQIVVEDGLSLTSPILMPDTIRMTTKASLRLAVNRPSTRFSVPSHSSSLIAVHHDKFTTLQSYNKEGSGVVDIQQLPSNRTSLVQVEVLPVKSIHLRVDLPASAGADDLIKHLPKNSRIRLQVEFRDAAGRLFHAAKNNIQYRRHREDLTVVAASSENRVFDVHLKGVGETIFKVWDAEDKNLSTFLRLIVGEPIPPAKPPTTIPKSEPIKQVAKPLVKEEHRGMGKPGARDEKPISVKGLISMFFGGDDHLSTAMLILLSIILVLGGYRLMVPETAEDENQRQPPPTPSHISEISPIQDRNASTETRNTWLSTDRPLYQSTPGSNSPAVGSTRPWPKERNSKSSPQCRNMECPAVEEQSPIRNLSHGSTGSIDDPYLWTTNDTFTGKKSALVNRYYK